MTKHDKLVLLWSSLTMIYFKYETEVLVSVNWRCPSHAVLLSSTRGQYITPHVSMTIFWPDLCITHHFHSSFWYIFFTTILMNDDLCFYSMQPEAGFHNYISEEATLLV